MLSVVIQAGGESRRMGQDKGLLPFLGQPLIQRVIERLADLADEMLITTNRQAEYQFLGLPMVSDLLPGRGALGGMYTALSAARRPFVAVVACDMPFVSARLLASLFDRLTSGEADLAMPHSGQGFEPFHAVYRRQTCLPAIEAALQADRWRVDAWFAAVKLEVLQAEDVRRYDSQMLCFRNINTPDELRQAEELALSMPD